MLGVRIQKAAWEIDEQELSRTGFWLHSDPIPAGTAVPEPDLVMDNMKV